MSAQSLPDRPNLDQLKRQAKELLASWQTSSSAGAGGPGTRLRDAQREIASRYGFDSWDALRAHVEQLTGSGRAALRRGLVYDDPIPDPLTISEPLTPALVRRLGEQSVAAVTLDPSVPPATFALLAEMPTLVALDLSRRDDIVDADLQILASMRGLTAVSLANCSRITDAVTAHLIRQPALAQLNLQGTASGDRAIATLAGAPALCRVSVGRLFTDDGAVWLRELPALATAGTLDSFLGISSARTLTDRGLEQIGQLSGLAALDVHMSAFGSPHYTAAGVGHLRQLPGLEQLNFHGVLANDAVLREIARIPRLRWLHCQDPVSGDDGFEALGACATLEWLACRFCHQITDRGLAAIARLPRLKSLSAGGRRLTSDALAPFAEHEALADLNPILSEDASFAYIARIPHLETLNNMYNRATTDAATRHLRGHARLRRYGAYGTQITDESLEVLTTVPRLESVEITTCTGITDRGLATLAQAPRLRALSVSDCPNVNGEWTAAAPRHVAAKSDSGSPDYAPRYVAETLMDHPQLPVPSLLKAPPGVPPAPGLLAPLVTFGGRVVFVDDVLQLDAVSEHAAPRAGVITREAFAAPLRIELVIKPLIALRFLFASHNRPIAFDEAGNVIDPMPWFMKTNAELGQAHGEPVIVNDDGWARVALAVSEGERRVFVNDVLRHSWVGDFRGVRSRIGIGVARSMLEVRELRVLAGSDMGSGG